MFLRIMRRLKQKTARYNDLGMNDADTTALQLMRVRGLLCVTIY